MASASKPCRAPHNTPTAERDPSGEPQPRRGRPPNPVDPKASHAARLGAELRTKRNAEGLTLEALGDLTGYTPQYVSEVERGKAAPAPPFVAACDRALEMGGALERLLPAAIQEREQKRQDRAAARRARKQALAFCDATHSEVAGDEDVEPTSRRELLDTAAAAAVSGMAGVAAAPAAAHDIDPELPAHWAEMLRLLGRHVEMFGPRGVIDIVRREARILAAYRDVARGELRTALMRVESRWAAFAAWLSEDTGDAASADAWGDHALHLAREARYPDMVAFARARQSRSVGERDARRAVELAAAGMGVRGASAQTQAWCARLAALGHARLGDTAACERTLANAYALLEDTDSPAPPWSSGYRVTVAGTRGDEAACMSHLRPHKAITLYERALQDWGRTEVLHGGLYRSRLAVVCAIAGDRDRAEAEGRRAHAIARATQSKSIERELRRLNTLLHAA